MGAAGVRQSRSVQITIFSIDFSTIIKTSEKKRPLVFRKHVKRVFLCFRT